MFKHHLIRTVAVVLALGAIAVPAAAARPLDLQTGATQSHDAVVTRGIYEPMRPEDQPQPPQDLRNPDTVDFANGRGTHNSPAVMVVDMPKPVPAPISAGGFDWGDAGLGAGGLLGITLIGLGGALFIVHRRDPRRVAT